MLKLLSTKHTLNTREYNVKGKTSRESYIYFTRAFPLPLTPEFYFFPFFLNPTLSAPLAFFSVSDELSGEI